MNGVYVLFFVCVFSVLCILLIRVFGFGQIFRGSGQLDTYKLGTLGKSNICIFDQYEKVNYLYIVKIKTCILKFDKTSVNSNRFFYTTFVPS